MKKNRFLANIAWHHLCQEARKHIFVHTICFGPNNVWPKQWKPGNTIKNVVSAEIAQNQKWHLLFEKGFFDMGERVGFTNCVFEKLCSSEDAIFIVLSAKHSSCNKKTVCWKEQKIYENSGLFLNMAKRCFLFVCFSGFNVIVVCFCVQVKLQKC